MLEDTYLCWLHGKHEFFNIGASAIIIPYMESLDIGMVDIGLSLLLNHSVANFLGVALTVLLIRCEYSTQRVLQICAVMKILTDLPFLLTLRNKYWIIWTFPWFNCIIPSSGIFARYLASISGHDVIPRLANLGISGGLGSLLVPLMILFYDFSKLGIIIFYICFLISDNVMPLITTFNAYPEPKGDKDDSGKLPAPRLSITSQSIQSPRLGLHNSNNSFGISTRTLSPRAFTYSSSEISVNEQENSTLSQGILVLFLNMFDSFFYVILIFLSEFLVMYHNVSRGASAGIQSFCIFCFVLGSIFGPKVIGYYFEYPFIFLSFMLSCMAVSLIAQLYSLYCFPLYAIYAICLSMLDLAYSYEISALRVSNKNMLYYQGTLYFFVGCGIALGSFITSITIDSFGWEGFIYSLVGFTAWLLLVEMIRRFMNIYADRPPHIDTSDSEIFSSTSIDLPKLSSTDFPQGSLSTSV